MQQPIKILLTVFFGLLIFLDSQAQERPDPLISGPMLGYVEHREVMLWIEVDSTVNKAQIAYWQSKTNQPDTQYVTQTGLFEQPFNPLLFRLSGLKMDTLYGYRVVLNGKTIPEKTFYFCTKKLWQWRTEPPDISFLFGSCVFINEEKYDRPGDPYGGKYKIFQSMAKKESRFMLWGGDNTYLREVDWHTESGMRYRYSHTRKTLEMQKLLASMAHYAIWDDHDYGPNNHNRSFYQKDKSLEVFKAYWANKPYGQTDHKGSYTKFRWSDAAFFLLDNRYHRAPNGMAAYLENGRPNPEKSYFGEEQLEWLKDQLRTSKATFKFIVAGGQFLNPLNNYEGFRDYPAEYQELTGFIRSREIPGVIFLSGDRHHTELIKLDEQGPYPLYDFTSSPLTSSSHDEMGNEENNPHRVPQTLVKERNFARLSLEGDGENRKLVIEVFDVDGEKLWEKGLKAEELGHEDE